MRCLRANRLPPLTRRCLATGMLLQELSRKSIDELMQVKGISQVTAQRIAAWFGSAENLDMATALTHAWGCEGGEHGLVVAPLTPTRVRGEATGGNPGVVCIAGVYLRPGDSIVATGAIPGVPRSKLEAWCVFAAHFSIQCVAACL